KPDVVFHLAGVVSGEAETDFEKGYRVNLDGTRALFEAIRAAAYAPKVIFTSSIAVFGAPFPPTIPDDFHLTPLTSYGTQKAIGELLLADLTRRRGCHAARNHTPRGAVPAGGPPAPRPRGAARQTRPPPPRCSPRASCGSRWRGSKQYCPC